jgi:hypothetical protein
LLKQGIVPFLTKETVASGKHGEFYYDNKQAQLLNKDRGWLLNFFERNGCFYEFNIPITIKKSNTAEMEFQTFFYLKLRQYHSGVLYINEFLYYQFKENFGSDEILFNQFLKDLLLQFEGHLSASIRRKIHLFITRPEVLQTLRKREAIDYENLPEIPKGYSSVPGKLPRAAVLKFFSFLYKEKSNNGKPFLSENDFFEVFKYGIAIPKLSRFLPFYKLNCSKRFPKSIIQFCIYKFFRIYTDGAETKRKVLEFFAIYFEDFNETLSSPEKFANFNKNVTGELPKRMAFDLQPYYPS